MAYLQEFFIIALIHLLAVASPGPDFALIVRNSLAYSRKTAVYSAIGLGLGILVHVGYSLVGIGFIISKSIILFSIIKLLGAGYLVYIGYKSLRAKPVAPQGQTANIEKSLGRFEAIQTGFLTNLLNPKATLFFLSIFTQVIKPETPLPVKLAYGLEMSSATFLWFAMIAFVVSHKVVKAKFSVIQTYAKRTMGIILIILGIKVAFSSSN